MAYFTAAVYAVAYCALFVGYYFLSCGYIGKSDVLEISSWKDCRKFIKRGWIIYWSSFIAIALAVTLNQIYFEEQWGWILISIAIFFVAVYIGPLAVMSEKKNNPYAPS